MMILRKQILVYRWKTNGFFIVKNIRKRIYIKRFDEFAFCGTRHKFLQKHGPGLSARQKQLGSDHIHNTRKNILSLSITNGVFYLTQGNLTTTTKNKLYDTY